MAAPSRIGNFHSSVRSVPWPLLLLIVGCARFGGRDAPSDAAGAAAGTAPNAPAIVALRLPGAGGPLSAYALPTLTALQWTPGGVASAVRGAVGMDVPGRRLLYRDTADAVLAFDLVSFHERAVAPRGALAALSADGALLAVDGRGVVVESEPWGVRSWPDTLGAGIAEVFAAPGPRLLAVRRRGGDSLLTVGREGGISSAMPLPAAADRAASREGDALALATDSGVVVVEIRDAGPPWFVRLDGTPHAVAFSPSGHRLYVALRGRNELAVIDRYRRAARPGIQLPAPAGAIRCDPWGRAVLLRPDGAEGALAETWVVGLAPQRLVGRIASEWDTDLPTVSPNGVLLGREGDAVVARDVHTLDSLGAVEAGAADYWFVGEWAPPGATAGVRQQARVAGAAPSRPADQRRPEPSPLREAQRAPAPGPARAPPPAASAPALWVQVSASQSENASRQLAAELARAGHPARLVTPRAAGDGWRVVLGPFATREAAEAAGRSLGRPFFIVERAPAETVSP